MDTGPNTIQYQPRGDTKIPRGTKQARSASELLHLQFSLGTIAWMPTMRHKMSSQCKAINEGEGTKVNNSNTSLPTSRMWSDSGLSGLIGSSSSIRSYVQNRRPMVVDPSVGTTFDSLDEAFSFYNL